MFLHRTSLSRFLAAFLVVLRRESSLTGRGKQAQSGHRRPAGQRMAVGAEDRGGPVAHRPYSVSQGGACSFSFASRAGVSSVLTT